MPFQKIKKPVQEREVFIVGRAAFLSLFCFFFLLIFYYYAKRSFAETVVNPAGLPPTSTGLL